jgi:FkbM family methyltransferase
MAKLDVEVDGVPLMTTAEASERFGQSGVFVVTILSSRLSFPEARRRLQVLGCERVISFFEMARTCAQGLLPHYSYDLPGNLLANGPEIRRAFHTWSDDESRRQFVRHIEFRLFADYSALPAASGRIYFPSDVPLPLKDAVFVDCGAYDGDTIREFIEVTAGQFRSIYAFEPDATNYSNLQRFVGSLDPQTRRCIHTFKAGVAGRRARLNFNATGDMGASFSPGGDIEVEAVPLHEVLSEERGESVYIKYDVEGAEMDALHGTAPLMARNPPALAVSAYHRPQDLWELPLYLASRDAGYQLFLRTQGSDGMDLICYAVPR